MNNNNNITYVSPSDDSVKVHAFKFNVDEFKKQIIDLLQLPDDIKDDIKKGRLNNKPKPQLNYLANYLDRLGTGTVIVEHRYVEPNLQADYWAYWTDDSVTDQYNWSRMHFFSGDILGDNSELLNEPIIDEKVKHLCQKLMDLATDAENKYNGYTVVVRGSEQFIAKTCLKEPKQEQTSTDDPDGSDNRLRTLRVYKANLLGVPLSLMSLGFMEQNSAVSACATCAVWSVLQKTAHTYNHKLSSPGEITRAAFGVTDMHTQLPVDKGLTIDNISRAFNATSQLNASVVAPPINKDLEEEEPDDEIKKESLDRLHAILDTVLPTINAGIPVLLQVRRPSSSSEKEYDHHAICLVGCIYDGSMPIFGGDPSLESEGIFRQTSKISRLIAHDDNIGPFVEYKIQPNGNISPVFESEDEADMASKALNSISQENSSHGAAGEESNGGAANNGNEYGGPWTVLSAVVALHRSIKVYNQWEILKSISPKITTPLGIETLWKWEIYKGNKYKEELVEKMKENIFDGDQDAIISLISKSLPIYIYVARAEGKEYNLSVVYSMTGPWRLRILGIIALNKSTHDLLKRISN